MENRYLIFDKFNTVVNIIIYDGVSEYNPGSGLTIQPYPLESDGSYSYVTIGSVKNSDGSWTHPEPVVSE